MVEPWIIGWPRAAEAGARGCGGKGWNLGRLDRYGFRVPAGGVVVADAYTQFMAAPAIEALRAELAGVPAAEAASPAVGQKLAALRAAIEAAELPDAVAAAVRSFLAGSGLETVPVAVRSSATAEDSPAASFAGIHHSVLHVGGVEPVLRAVRECYASLWTPQALAYRRRLGLADDQVSCAVVICAMVSGPGGGPPAAAGVAFSCDPRTGRRDMVTISAAAGLGDAVVSGQVNPDEIAVVLTGGRLDIARRSGRAETVLTDAQALELARLTLRVHWALGDGQDPQDVEWAFDGRQFWLLQARPVTRLPRPTFPAIAHRPVIWSNANLKDVIPGVQSTMGWSIFQPALRELLYTTLDAVGYAVPPGMETVRRFAGRTYFDLSSLQWAYYDALGLPPAETNRTIGGCQPAIAVPPTRPLARPRAWLARQVAALKVLRLLLRLPGEFPRDLVRAYADARAFKAVDRPRLSNAELLELGDRLGEVQAAFGPRFQLANADGGAWQAPLEAILRRVAPGRARALTAALMAGSGQVTSAEQGYRLVELADAARRDPAAQEYLHQAPRDPQGWRRLPDGSPFRAELERFLTEFGHRGIYEVEIANPRWNEDPTYLLDQVRVFLAAGSPRPARDTARETRAAAEAEVVRATRAWRPVIRWLAARARQGAALREAAKSAIVALLEPGRLITLEIGRRMAAGGVLADPSDVFHLAWMAAETYLRGEWDGTGAWALVADRKARAASWLTETPPDVIILGADGSPAPALTAGQSRGGATLAGVGVAAGRASGPGRIVRHPSEGHRLEPGDVLVAPSTDPAWTPLFLRASAVVMEVGGYLSHGAIVAREYGIPAVVNIPELLTAVQDGQLLTVDGDAGQVMIGNGPTPPARPG